MKRSFKKTILPAVLILALLFAFTAQAFAQSGDAGSASSGSPAASQSSGQDGSSEPSQEDSEAAAEKRELYTMMTLIAMGAAFVGIREKNRRR